MRAISFHHLPLPDKNSHGEEGRGLMRACVRVRACVCVCVVYRVVEPNPSSPLSLISPAHHYPSCIPLSCILQLFLGLSPSTLSTSLSTSPSLPLAQPHPPFLSLSSSLFSSVFHSAFK